MKHSVGKMITGWDDKLQLEYEYSRCNAAVHRSKK